MRIRVPRCLRVQVPKLPVRYGVTTTQLPTGTRVPADPRRSRGYVLIPIN